MRGSGRFAKICGIQLNCWELKSETDELGSFMGVGGKDRASGLLSRVATEWYHSWEEGKGLNTVWTRWGLQHMCSSSSLWTVRDPEWGAQERPEGADKKVMLNKRWLPQRALECHARRWRSQLHLHEHI